MSDIAPSRIEAGSYAIWHVFASGARKWMSPEEAEYRWRKLPEATKAAFRREAEACIKATEGMR